MDARLLDKSLPTQASLAQYLPAVRNQGSESDCTSFALCGAVEGQRAKDGLPAVTLSPAFIFYAARSTENEQSQDVGLFMPVVLRTAQSVGIATEGDDAYVDGAFAAAPSATAIADAKQYAICGWNDLTPYQPSDAILSGQEPNAPLVNAVRQAISHGHFVLLNVASSALSNVSPDGVVPMPADPSLTHVDHEVFAYDYDDASQTFSIQNSWGADWSKNGRAEIPYDFVSNLSLCNDGYTVNVVKPVVTPKPSQLPVTGPQGTKVPVTVAGAGLLSGGYVISGHTWVLATEVAAAFGTSAEWTGKGVVIPAPKG